MRTTWHDSGRRQRLPKGWATVIRPAVLDRDHHTCVMCGRPGNQVDHITPGDNHDLQNLQTLCAHCHATKSASEGGKAIHRGMRRQSLRKRPPEHHPGLS